MEGENREDSYLTRAVKGVLDRGSRSSHGEVEGRQIATFQDVPNIYFQNNQQ
jgi:hypothetical protein